MLYFIYLFFAGGAAYQLIEMAWRGGTHWSMFILGGICVVSVNMLYAYVLRGHGLLLFCLAGGALITVLEYITGLIVNVGFGWNVWDYSALPLNVNGQVCLLYSCLWALLCIPAAGLGVVIDGIVFGQGAA